MTRRPYVVIEGADGTGKTTLATAFERAGLRSLHSGPPTKPAFEYYSEILDEAADGWAVIDRLHAGSFVYGNVFRGGDDLEWYEHWLLEGRLMSCNSLMIHSCPSGETTDAVIARGPKDDDAVIYEAVDLQPEVRFLFKKFMSDVTMLPTFEYDWEAPDAVQSMVAEIMATIEYFASSCPDLSSSRPFGNVYSPLFCLVGVEPSKYLFQSLRAARISLNQICILPEPPEKRIDSQFWISTQFVAFDSDVDRRLSDLDISHRGLPHPDFVRQRFYKDMARYGATIRGDSDFMMHIAAEAISIEREKKPKFSTLKARGFIVP